MYTRKCRCVFTSLPPSCLIYCICAPSQPRVFRLRFFSPRIWVTFYFTSAHLAYFVFLIFFCRGHFSGSGIFGLRFIWCPTWPAPTLAQIFSLMHQHWQIDPKYAASSLKSIISVSILTEIFSLVPEIGKVRGNLFQINGYVKEPLILPEGSGPPVIHSEKVYVPVKEHPDVSIIILFIFKIICFSIPSLSFYLSHNFSQYLCFQEVAIYKYCSYCPSEIPIVTILRRKKRCFYEAGQSFSSLWKTRSRGWQLFVETFEEKLWEIAAYPLLPHTLSQQTRLKRAGSRLEAD